MRTNSTRCTFLKIAADAETGMQIRIVEINDDGNLDIAVAEKVEPMFYLMRGSRTYK